MNTEQMTKILTEVTEVDLERSTPQEILRWAVNRFNRICIAASFGKDSVTLLHMLQEIEPHIDVIYLNTGYDFEETLRFIEQLQREWNLNIKEYRPKLTVEEQERLYGKDLYKTDPNRCCGIRKVEPMDRALENYDAWITGLRRDETEFRKGLKIVEVQKAVKVNPLAAWTEADLWRYIRANRVPYNPLYDRGYRSLGCKPCSNAGTWGRFERAGRWAGTDKQGGECGIHLSYDQEKIKQFFVNKGGS